MILINNQKYLYVCFFCIIVLVFSFSFVYVDESNAITAIFLLLFTISFPLFLIVKLALNGLFFTTISFWSIIFIIESFTGFLKFNLFDENIAFLNSSLLLYVLSYVAFLCGYFIYYFFIANTDKKKDRLFNIGNEVIKIIFVLLAFFTITKVTSFFVKVLNEGGLRYFLNNMYSFRYGTNAASTRENAAIVFLNMVNASYRPVLCLGFYFYLKKCYTGFEKKAFYCFIIISFFLTVLSGFRGAVIIFFVSLIAIYDDNKSIKPFSLFKILTIILFFLFLLNFYHYYMYYLTAGWVHRDFGETLQYLLAPHGHLKTLSLIYKPYQDIVFLHGETILESIFFFIPRFIWESKAVLYGTGIVQEWAGLPTWFQMAPTAIGELYAHFGYVGIVGMILYGALHSYFDTYRFGDLIDKALFYGLLLPKVLTHSGMGISAVMITIFQACLFIFLFRFCFRLRC